MTDFYLKFASEEEARTVLYTVTPAVYEVDEEGNTTDVVVTEEQVKPNYMNIDVLGVIYERIVEPITDPEITTAPLPLEGWHVNVRVVDGEDGEPLEAFKVNPEPMTWRRVWG